MVLHLQVFILVPSEIETENANNATEQIWISYDKWLLLVPLPHHMRIITSIILILINNILSINSTSTDMCTLINTNIPLLPHLFSRLPLLQVQLL